MARCIIDVIKRLREQLTQAAQQSHPTFQVEVLC
jgi:hypothetical protein